MEDELLAIVKKHPTPCYIYKRDIIESKCDELKDCIMPGTRLFYSMKANPLIGICQIMKNKGCGIETASIGELMTAFKAGFQPNDIIFTSPGKTIEELEYAIKNRIKAINVESLMEAEMINDIAKKYDFVMPIAIRVNPSICYSNAKIKMSGVSSQFGIDEGNINKELFDRLYKLEYIKVIGIQVYMGTQMLLAQDIINNSDYILKLAIDMSKKYGFELQYINLGGGFGVPYFINEKELNLVELKNGMLQLYKKYLSELTNVTVIMESGRYLMADSGFFITKVLYVKESKKKKYVVCDGGSNFHSSAAFLGRFVRNNFPITSWPSGEELEDSIVTGPLCTPLDVIGQQVKINKEIAPGDYIVIKKSGAYGLTYSPVLFLSHQQPEELLVLNGKVQTLRGQASFMDYISNQNTLERVE